MKSNLPSPENLQTAIAQIEARAQQMAGLSREKATLEKKIGDYIAAGDGSDQARLLEVAGFRIRLEMIPGVVRRLEAENEAMLETLLAAMRSYEHELAAAGAAEREALLDEMEEVLKPYTVDWVEGGVKINGARRAAGALSILNLIPTEASQLRAPYFNESGNAAELLTSALPRARALLEIGREVEKRGSFVPENWNQPVAQ